MEKAIYSQVHKQVVAKLVKARKNCKLKQQDVAKKLGKTQSYISKIESGQTRVDVVEIRELASIYKKSPSYFID